MRWARFRAIVREKVCSVEHVWPDSYRTSQPFPQFSRRPAMSLSASRRSLGGTRVANRVEQQKGERASDQHESRIGHERTWIE